MAEKRCKSTRTHKPHLWSRTTRKTVTEETAGDTLQCPGSARVGLRTEADVRGAQIAADARLGTNWAERVNYGPACICGAGQRTNEAALALKAPLTAPSGMCARHPGGSVWASRPEDWKKIRGTQEG